MKNSTPRPASNRWPNRDETEFSGKAEEIEELPAPLTPANCDLRDQAFIPLDVAHVGNSTPGCDIPPEARETAILLCCVAWLQVPAASLPDDDAWLARCAGYRHRGNASKKWLDIRASALRGWIRCSDERLYHPALAAQAREAWAAKLKQHTHPECTANRKKPPGPRIAYAEADFDDRPSVRCHNKDACNASGEMHCRAMRNVQLAARGATGENNRRAARVRLSTGNRAASPHRGEKYVMSVTEISASLIRWERERGKSARGLSSNHPHVAALARMALTPNELRRAYNSAVANRLSTNDQVPMSVRFIGTFVTTHRNRLQHRTLPNADD
jgi:hypothetical protein